MDQWREQTKKLTEAIRDSQAFREYRHLEDRIKEDDEIFQMVKNYRRESFELQMTDNEKWMGNDWKWKYEKALSLSYVNEFLGAEMKLCRLYRTVWSMICQDSGLDMDFLDS